MMTEVMGRTLSPLMGSQSNITHSCPYSGSQTNSNLKESKLWRGHWNSKYHQPSALPQAHLSTHTSRGLVLCTTATTLFDNTF